MAALIGNIGPFDEKSEKFSDYADRFEAYVAANDIDNDKKVNVFLAVIGPDAYKLLKNLCDPENSNTKTFTRLSQLLQGHFEPTPIVIAERHKFWTASQEESESVSEFVGNSWRDWRSWHQHAALVLFCLKLEEIDLSLDNIRKYPEPNITSCPNKRVDLRGGPWQMYCRWNGR